MAYWILVPQPRMEPRPLAVKAWSFNRWTTRKSPEIFQIRFIRFATNELNLCGYCSVTQLCPTLCEPMDYSITRKPGFQVLHYLQVCSDSCPSSQWCHPTILSSVVPFTSCLQSFPASGSFLKSQFLHQVVKVLELQLWHQSLQWIFRIDFL